MPKSLKNLAARSDAAHAVYQRILENCRSITTIYETAGETAKEFFMQIARDLQLLMHDPHGMKSATGYDSMDELLIDPDIREALSYMRLQSYTQRRRFIRTLHLDSHPVLKQLNLIERMPKPRQLRQLEEIAYSNLKDNEKLARAQEILADDSAESTIPPNIDVRGLQLFRDGTAIGTFTDWNIYTIRLVSMLASLNGTHFNVENRQIVCYINDERRVIMNFSAMMPANGF